MQVPNVKKELLRKKPIIFFFAFIFTIPILTAQTFSGSFDLVAIQNYPNGNVRNDTISYFFGKEKTAIIITGQRNDPDMRMIFNPSDSTITALFEINGKKGGFILPLDEKHWPGMSHGLSSYAFGARTEPNYTGDSKTIEGFSCRKVLAENDDYHAVLWLTEDIPLSMMRVLSYQSVGAGESKKELELFDQFGVGGLPLEMLLTSKQGKANVSIKLVNFKNKIDDEVFSTEGHEVSIVK